MAAILALLVAWTCYGLVGVELADREAGRCLGFGDLAGKCSAPFLRFFGGISVMFACATLALAFLALRSPKSGGK